MRHCKNFRPRVEELESRLAPAALVSYLSGTDLIVRGNGLSNLITVEEDVRNGRVIVRNDGNYELFSRSAVGRVVAYGFGGNDRLDGRKLLTKSFVAYGGDGADTLLGGGAGDSLYGQAGSDTMRGYRGRDAFIGGAGVDSYLRGILDAAIVDSGLSYVSNDPSDEVAVWLPGMALLSGHYLLTQSAGTATQAVIYSPAGDTVWLFSLTVPGAHPNGVLYRSLANGTDTLYPVSATAVVNPGGLTTTFVFSTKYVNPAQSATRFSVLDGGVWVNLSGVTAEVQKQAANLQLL